MRRVILDCDNTMGTGADVDDGLALLYLLGHADEIELVGITCTYGNSDIETVYANTRRLTGELGLDVPVVMGSGGSDDADSEAARFLAEAACGADGGLHLLATGSLTNLKGADAADPSFFGRLAGVWLMGGIEHSLFVNGHPMDELNFSCDAAATHAVLSAPCPVTVATAQACLPATFTRELFAYQMGEGSLLMRECESWFAWMGEKYGMEAFVCWDVVAAAALVAPELFFLEEREVSLNRRLFSVGYLERPPADSELPGPVFDAAPGAAIPVAASISPAVIPAAARARIRIPRIKDPDAFRDSCFSAWKNAIC